MTTNPHYPHGFRARHHRTAQNEDRRSNHRHYLFFVPMMMQNNSDIWIRGMRQCGRRRSDLPC
jgi:hypothetical protein